jgi:hypothetical protein
VAEKFYLGLPGHLVPQAPSDAANRDARYHLVQDFADASAAQAAGHSAAAGCPESYPAPVHGCPFVWALADAPADQTVPDAKALRLMQAVPLAERRQWRDALLVAVFLVHAQLVVALKPRVEDQSVEKSLLLAEALAYLAD